MLQLHVPAILMPWWLFEVLIIMVYLLLFFFFPKHLFTDQPRGKLSGWMGYVSITQAWIYTLACTFVARKAN